MRLNKVILSRPVRIILHILFWLIFTLIPIRFAEDMNFALLPAIFHSAKRTVTFVILFYINYYILIKSFLSREKYIHFVLVNMFLIFILHWFKDLHLFRLLSENQERRVPFRPRRHHLILYLDFLIYLVPIAVSIALRSFQQLTKLQLKQAKEEKSLVQQELQYLKYQVQPHFFFNSLNNIYSLIDLDTEKAKDAVHSLSKLMRYMLYRTTNGNVELKEEIEFIEQYIELMRLRMRKNTTIIIDFPTYIPSLRIAPLLFVSLVENAFKHGVSATEASEIVFKLQIEENAITFLSENTNFPKTNKDHSGSGLGLKNLKKRLDLLYPNCSELTSFITGDRYFSKLEIQLG